MAQRTHKIGLDANAPIDAGSGRLAGRLADPEIIAGTGAAWVRINFIIGPWSDPNDSAGHSGGRNWLQTYQGIIDQYLERGLNIYGLVGHESVKSSVGLPDFFREHVDQTADKNRAQRWIADYVNAFERIVNLFFPKVKIYESFNEPDDWHGQQKAWIHPTWYAVMLTEIYRRLKLEKGMNQVTLVTGPLQGLEINNNDAPTRYLREAYQYGRERLGWGRGNMPYPFDGIGYHLYINENFNSNWAAQEQLVRQTYRRYVDQVLQIVRNFEGANTNKKLYISEIGWHSNGDTPQEKEFQAKNLSLALELLVNDPAVAVAIWFCAEDFAPGHKFYGLYQMGRPTPEGRKPAYQAFKTFCDRLLAAPPAEPRRPVQPQPPAEPRPPISPPVLPRVTPGQPAGRTSPQPTLFEQMAQLRNQLTQLQAELQRRMSAQPNAPGVNLAAINQTLGQLGQQSAQLQGQMAALRGQVQQLAAQQSRLQSQVQQLQSQPAGGSGASGGTGPGTRALPPGTSGRAGPAIEDITGQLKRHPTLRFQTRPLNQIQQIIINHTAIPPHIGADKIANYGVGSKGWPGFKYHYFITGQGRIQQTNQLTTLSTHAGPYSPTSVGVGFAGNFSQGLPTPAQLDAGAQLIAGLLRQFNLSTEAIFGYKELVATESPGLQWDGGARWGDQLKARIRAYQ